MSSITVRDLTRNDALDSTAMQSVRGGNSWLKDLGSLANVNVGVNQNITQIQNVGVNVLNNVGAIGAGFCPPEINVSPNQWANAYAGV